MNLLILNSENEYKIHVDDMSILFFCSEVLLLKILIPH